MRCVRIALVMGLVGPSFCANTAVGANQGEMFGGVTLPPDSMVYAVAEGSDYDLYVVHLQESWPEYVEGETWAEYLQRVNAAQEMPSATFSPVHVVSDSALDQRADSVNMLSHIDAAFKLGWGYVSGAGEDHLVVAWMTEIVILDSSAPLEERTLRSFWVYDYPDTEDEAADLMALIKVPYFQPHDPGKGWTESSTASTTRPSENLMGPTSVTMGPEILVEESHSELMGEAPQGEAGVIGMNAAGIACLAAYNAASDQCNMDYARTQYDCTDDFIDMLIGAAFVCIPATAINPGLALACAGGAMLIGAGSTYVCRETRTSEHVVCMHGAGQIYAACCAQEGTNCGDEA